MLNILKKKMTLIANVFPTLETAKDVVGQMSEKTCFGTPLNCQQVKGP